MKTQYYSEAEKVRDMPQVMQYIRGKILDYGCGGDKIVPQAIGVDGRKLPGVDLVVPDLENPTQTFISTCVEEYDTVFSAHFLEHCLRPYDMVMMWHQFLKPMGHLVLYLPDAEYYDHDNNPEHTIRMEYDDFIFWFKRNFCGEGKNYRGENHPQYFKIIKKAMDVGPDRYSFYFIAQAV